MSEYGRTKVTVDTASPIFAGMDRQQVGLMSHTDQCNVLPAGFVSIAQTRHCPNAAVADYARKLYGLQFHPEVENTPNGAQMIRNFLFNVCGAKGDYDLGDYEARMIAEIREQVGGEHVVLGLSGGVDSSVCAALLAKAIPGRLHCIFVDHGLMRKNEGDEVEAAFAGRDLHFIRVNAEERFLRRLMGVTDPERKRKIIGEEFVRVFEEEAAKLGDVRFLAQGTIYPDVIESASTPPSSRATTPSAACRRTLSLPALSSRSEACLRTKSASSAAASGCRRRLSGASPSPGPALPSAASAR